MTLRESRPAAIASPLPDGIVIRPRRFEFRELAALPQYWFAGNPIITHIENAFSILIPPGERFFIRSVRRYADRVSDPEQRRLIQAFVQQESLHSRAHDEFNASFAGFGVDVARETAYAERVFQTIERRVPARLKLGMTVFLEHLTATGAHMLFSEPVMAASMHPEALRFWRWHAAEELEHKAVAFDLLQRIGGGYLLRVFSAVLAVLLLAVPITRIARRMLRADGRPISPEMRRQARAINRKLARPQLRMLGQFFKPGFHPWQSADEVYLRSWYASAEGV